jgi:two-component system, OmpR family, sensor kinase
MSHLLRHLKIDTIFVRSLILALGSALALAIGTLLLIVLTPPPFVVPASSFEIARALRGEPTVRTHFRLSNSTANHAPIWTQHSQHHEIEQLLRLAIARQLPSTPERVVFEFPDAEEPNSMHAARRAYESQLVQEAALYGDHINFNPLAFDEFRVAWHKSDGSWSELYVEAPGPRWETGVAKLIGFALLLILPIVWFFSRALARPIAALADAAQRIGQGEKAVVPELGTIETQHAARTLNVMQSQLEQTLSERSRMMAAIAHDLRTPIARLSFLLSDLPEDKSAKVQSQLEEMDQLVGATLDYVRIDQQHIERSPLDLRSLLEGLVDDYLDWGKSARFVGDTDCVILGDTHALRRLFNNIVSNALRYGSEVEVRLQRQLNQALVEIDDNGPGMTEANLQQAFEPFARGESSRNRSQGGAGLGLTIARAIARAHGGDIELRNRAHRGLSVIVRLPMQH